MAININIRRVLSLTTWSLAGAGVLVLLLAAIRYRNNNTCKGYRIDITGPVSDPGAGPGASAGLFINKADVAALLASAGADNRPGRPIQSYDLRRLELALGKNIWIKKAQLFFDNNGILRVNVAEREPATRIFTNDGNSFFIDSSGIQLPLIARLPVKLPVFTGYPSAKPGRRVEDSVLTAGIRHLSAFIRKDPFWMAQIAQVNITPQRTFELEPVVGNHRVIIGSGDDAEKKFQRLFLFYKQVLSRTGFDKYERIDVSYSGQVIATRKGSGQSRYDSLQGMNNIRQLIRSAQQMQPDTIRQQSVRPLERSIMTEQNLGTYDLLPGARDSVMARPPHEKQRLRIK